MGLGAIIAEIVFGGVTNALDRRLPQFDEEPEDIVDETFLEQHERNRRRVAVRRLSIILALGGAFILLATIIHLLVN
jgi:hypothetical protein